MEKKYNYFSEMAKKEHSLFAKIYGIREDERGKYINSFTLIP
jgi:abortive infection bacteriophage resistance protein